MKPNRHHRQTAGAPIHPVLSRQLRKAGIDEAAPPSAEAWHALLSRISAHYQHIEGDRALLTRSLEVSTKEAEALRSRVMGERDRLSELLETIGRSLAIFVELLSTDDQSASETEARLRGEFVRYVSESLSGAAPSHGGDFVDETGIRDRFFFIADQFLELLRSAGDRAGMRKELELAGVVQRMLLPRDSELVVAGLNVFAHFVPASAAGGDWWAVETLPDGRVMLIVGDVTGHGAASAIITGVARGALHVARRVYGERLTAEVVLKLLHGAIRDVAGSQLLMSAIVATYHPEQYTLRITNAGHPFPYLRRQDGSIHTLPTQSSPLGLDALDVSSRDVTLSPGDVVLLYTDGVVDCENSQKKRFGDRRLHKAIASAAPRTAQHMRDAVVDAVTAFRDGREPVDDTTLVALDIS